MLLVYAYLQKQRNQFSARAAVKMRFGFWLFRVAFGCGGIDWAEVHLNASADGDTIVSECFSLQIKQN
jgi:hypothetical protein